MNKRISKFLEFNGKTLSFLSVEGEYWIALKPICEALGVDYIQQFKNAQSSPIYSKLLCKHTMVAADGKVRKMISLPEKRIYGWLMQIQSNAPGLIEYQTKCHDILFDYFHGAITGRKELLSQKAKAQIEIDQVMNSLSSDHALKLQKARQTISRVSAKLRKLDGDLLQDEKNLFS